MRIILFIMASFLATASLATADTIKVVALVNDQIISSVDLNDRATLVMSTTGIANTEENRARLLPQILNQLIDEKLQMQEATQDSITISDDKLKDGIALIEKQSNKPAGSLEQFLNSKGVSKLSFFEQVRAQMAWSEIIIKKIRPKVRVSNQEVARYLALKPKQVNGEKVTEVMITTIQLPVDSPKNEASVHKVADKLAGEIKSGASFEAVATQFSSSVGDTKSSDPFWVEITQLDPAIAKELIKVSKGGVSDPIRTEAGYQIIKLVDTRQKVVTTSVSDNVPSTNTEFAYKQIILSPKDTTSKKPEALFAQAKAVTLAPGKCDGTAMNGNDFNFAVTFVRALSTNMPEALRNVLGTLKVGGTSDPIPTPQGIRIFMLCERTELPQTKISITASEDAARQKIYEEKLQLEAQKFLRNLRREAFIEIRGL